MVQLKVLVDPVLLKRFRLVALKQDKSAQQLIREFIVWYVEKQEATGG